MKTRLITYALAGLATALLSSCGAASGVQQMANRMVQAVGRTAGLGN